MRHPGAQQRRVLQDFTTANLDFIQHYRLRRMYSNGRSKMETGIAVTGHHEILLPILADG